jgi:L-seryl-tRNA(Ser) seleniumtransferase
MRLGVTPVINGVGTVTVLGGSLMPREVLDSMEEAAHHFIPLPELQQKAGEHIANLLGVPAAMVTCGAASAITVAAVACMTRGDRTKLDQLPDVTGMPFEIIQQKTHRSGYEHQMTLAGAKILTVETRQELDSAISPRTAMLFFLNKADGEGRIKRAEWVEVGRKRGIPSFTDAAADVPPKGRLGQYVKEGFDLVAFSGGKGLLGPQSAGLLLGRKDLVEAATLAISPNGGIGRGMKVGKEEIAGMVAAVERYLRVDHDAEIRELDRRVSEMTATLRKVSGLRLSRHVPEIANEVPHLTVEWDEQALKLTSADAVERLKSGSPPIWVSRIGAGVLRISPWMMKEGEHRVVAGRVRALFA